MALLTSSPLAGERGTVISAIYSRFSVSLYEETTDHCKENEEYTWRSTDRIATLTSYVYDDRYHRLFDGNISENGDWVQ